MSEKLIKHRASAEPPRTQQNPIAPVPVPPRESHAGRAALIVGPAIGFVLAASLAISFALALAGGAGTAALGSDAVGQPTRMAVFVL